MTLLSNETDQIITLTINRPEAGNRLNSALIQELTQKFSEIEQRIADGRNPVTAVVLAASGEDFSLGRERSGSPVADPKVIAEEFSRIQALNEAIQSCRAVTIAAIHGRAEGAGLSLAARTDIIIVADNARLCFPEIPHGIPPTIVLSHYRYHLPKNLLGEIFFLGKEISGNEAVSYGLASRVVPASNLEASITEITEQLKSFDHDALRLVKDFLIQTQDLPSHAAPNLGIQMYANNAVSTLLKNS